MNRTHHGSGSGSELHDAPPNSNLHNTDSALPNGHEAKGEVIDAGLRSLDHCMSPPACPPACPSCDSFSNPQLRARLSAPLQSHPRRSSLELRTTASTGAATLSGVYLANSCATKTGKHFHHGVMTSGKRCYL